MGLSCLHELVQSLLLLSHLLFFVSDVFWTSCENTQAFRIVDGWWLGSQEEVFHAKFHLEFVSELVRLWSDILIDDWDQSSSFLIDCVLLIYSFSVFISEDIGDHGSCYKALALTDSGLGGNQTLLEGHGSGEL